MAAVLERHGVGAGTRIRNIEQRQGSPGFPRVLRRNREHLSLARATDGLQLRASDAIVKQDARLNCANSDAVVQRRRCAPSFAAVRAPLEMHRPLAGLLL